MRNICAYLLASMGNNTVSVENMKNILASVGVEADESQLKVVMEKFAGKQVEKLITQGNMLMSATGGGGGMAAAKAGGAAPAAAAAAAPKAEEKKEEKKEEEEESDDDMGFGLFD